jgi:phenylalanyl-tRNA synthetase beta chain
MKAPLSWLRELVELPTDLTPQDISDLFVRVGFEVEEVMVQGADITGPLLVGKVLLIEELSGHKKPIRYVALDCGEAKTRSVICGARNFAEGDHVVVAIPGAVLPGDFHISSRETYGKISDGMICSAKELGLGDDHSGIIVLSPEDAPIGADAVELLGINDVIFDIAVNPDRGYALSIRGLARELAGALDLEFNDPARLRFSSLRAKDGGTPCKIREGANEIFLRTVADVDMSRPTPLSMRRKIEKCGMRSISLPVDITNYLMLELGQPLHAFDADQIAGTLQVRSAKKGEKLTTLDGEERVLNEGDLTIADDKKVLALAGTMGGAEAEVSEKTLRITVEAAHFHSDLVARNSRRHRLSTEASRRFERFVDPAMAEIASMRALEFLVQHAGASYVGTSHDGDIGAARSIEVDLRRLNAILGREYSSDEMSSMLERIGCQSTNQGNLFTVVVPSWRPDLNTDADFAEELARIHGYDVIPLRLPVAKAKVQSLGSASEPDSRKRRRLVVDFLASRGFAETQNYPFTSQRLIEELGFEGARARSFKITNPLSDEFPVMRTHILQSLLPTAVRNINRGNGQVAIFEVGRIFRAPEKVAVTSLLATGSRPSDDEVSALLSAVPNQPTMLAGVIAGEMEKSGWWGRGREGTWVDAVSMAAEVIGLLGSSVEINSSDLAPWHPGRCAELRVGNTAVAHAGELHPRVIELLGLPVRSVAFAVILDLIPGGDLVKPGKLATMPPAIQDVALVVDASVSAERVREALKEGAGELLESIELFDRYEKFAPGKISLAFTLTLRAADRTLTSTEISEVRNRAIATAAAQTGAVLRS